MSLRIDDGFKTIFSFANYPTVKFYEKTVTPPGLDGGGMNDTTTMRNTRWRTRAPKKLLTMTAMTASCAYDPEVYEDIVAMMQENQLITVTFPDESTVEFWGAVDKFVPGEVKEGDQPVATVTIEPTNQDEDGTEVAPVYTPAP